MPTETLTDERVVEILARRGMGWKCVPWHEFTLNFPGESEKSTATESIALYKETAGSDGQAVRAIFTVRAHCMPDAWNPIESLDLCHEVEERLTKEQRTQYRDTLLKTFIPGEMGGDDYWELTHADARTKAYALATVLRKAESNENE